MFNQLQRAVFKYLYIGTLTSYTWFTDNIYQENSINYITFWTLWSKKTNTDHYEYESKYIDTIINNFLLISNHMINQNHNNSKYRRTYPSLIF